MKNKKYLLVCIFLLCFKLYGVQDISTNTVFTLFPSTADIIQSIYDNPFEKQFGSFTNDYFFVNLKSNPVAGLKNTNAFIDFKLGYYGAYTIPFSITAGFFYAPYTDSKNLLEFTNISGVGSTNFQYADKKGFNAMGGSLQFLTKIYALSTGIRVGFTYYDKSFITTNMSFLDSTGSLINSRKIFNQNDSYYVLNAAIPFYVKHNNYFKHYFEIGLNYEQHFDSNGGTTKNGAGLVITEDYKLKSSENIKPYLFYQFGYTFAQNMAEFQIRASGSVDIYYDILNTSSKLPTEPIDKLSTIRVYFNKYNIGYNADIDMGILFQALQDTGYVIFRMRPALAYSFERAPSITNSYYRTTSSIGEALAPINYMNEISHSVYIYTPMALKIYNSSWPLGAVIASYMKFGYEYKETETSYIGTNRVNNGKSLSYSHGWMYDIKTQFGLFVPIKDIYMFEASVNFDKQFAFESFDIRFTTPIIYKTKIKNTPQNNIQTNDRRNDTNDYYNENDNLYNVIDETSGTNNINPESNIDDKGLFRN